MDIKELIKVSLKKNLLPPECNIIFVANDGELHNFEVYYDEITQTITSKDHLYISFFKWIEEPIWNEKIRKLIIEIKSNTGFGKVSILYIHEKKELKYDLNKFDYPLQSQ